MLVRDKEASCQGDQIQHDPRCAVLVSLWNGHQDDLESLEKTLWSSLSQPTETPCSATEARAQRFWEV